MIVEDNVMKRFWTKVDKTSECWLWTGALNKGYGAFSIKNKAKQAHRLAYQFVKGQIPEGLELDHLCKTKHCVNPSHLEPVTHKVNIQRADSYWTTKTHCPKGHEYSPENTGVNSKGSRWCRACHRVISNQARNNRVRVLV